MQKISDYIKVLEGPILVTGAAGFVGANLFKRLTAERHDVYAVVRDDKGWRLAEVHDDQIAAADLTDRNAVKHLLDSIGPRTVFDCAAYGAYSFEQNIDLIYQTNFFSVVGLVEALAELASPPMSMRAVRQNTVSIALRQMRTTRALPIATIRSPSRLSPTISATLVAGVMCRV